MVKSDVHRNIMELSKPEQFFFLVNYVTSLPQTTYRSKILWHSFWVQAIKVLMYETSCFTHNFQFNKFFRLVNFIRCDPHSNEMSSWDRSQYMQVLYHIFLILLIMLIISLLFLPVVGNIQSYLLENYF